MSAMKNALRGTEPIVRTRLAESSLSIAVPWNDFCGLNTVTFGEMDKELHALLRVAYKHCQKHEMFIDIGANLGIFCLRLAADMGIKCVAVEPQPNLAELLRYNSSEIGISNLLDIREIALGSMSGEAKLSVSEDNSGNSMLITDADGAFVTVQLKKIDDIITSEIWATVRLLKIDVEGYELEVFRGGGKRFREHRPTIVFEMNEIEMTKLKISPAKLVNELRIFGYTDFYALGPVLYPIANGVYKVQNYVALGSNDNSLVEAYGYSAAYRPKPAKNIPIVNCSI
jgi:FkbM family methyltransferase